MVKNYYISEEGKKAFADIGLEYPIEIHEQEFNEWYTKKTNDDKLPEGYRPKYIGSMIRLRVPNYQTKPDEIVYEEYIIHDMLITRMEKIGNVRQRYQPVLIGVYPKPIPRYEIVLTADFDRVKKLDGFDSITSVYSIPFTKEKANELFQKYCDRKTQFSIKDGDHIGGSRAFSIKSFEDWRDGKFDDLLFWGHVPTKTEIAYKDEETKQREKVRAQIEIETRKKNASIINSSSSTP